VAQFTYTSLQQVATPAARVVAYTDTDRLPSVLTHLAALGINLLAAGDPAKYEKRRDATFRLKRGVPVRDVTGAAGSAPAAGIGLSRR
jgi:hypothetical protein